MDDVTLCLFQPREGQTAVCRIVNTDGQTVNTATAVRTGNSIEVTLAQAAKKTIDTVIVWNGQKQESVLAAGQTTVSVVLPCVDGRHSIGG
jgi:hypothetical protein